MLAKRIIPCLDVKDGRVVKGTNFAGLRDVEDPVALASFYNESGADELVFYDISASYESRGLFTDVLRSVAERVFIPLTAGGGVNGIGDFDRALRSGADKVSVNSGALADPTLISRAAEKYGNQCVVLSMDVKLVDGVWRVFRRGGRDVTPREAVEWAKYGEEHGAGEIVVNSIDTDGVKGGFDLPLLRAVASEVRLPVIASGGAGTIGHFVDLFRETDVDAGLGASVFHFREIGIRELKEELRKEHIEVRL